MAQGIPKGLVPLALVANNDLCTKTPDLTYYGVTGKHHVLEPRSWTFCVWPKADPLATDSRIYFN